MNKALAICSAVLFVFMLLENYWLHRLAAVLGFSAFMVFSVVGVAVLIAIGYGWDAIERNRSRAEPRSTPLDYPRPEPLRYDPAGAIEHQSTLPNADRAGRLGPKES
jgi:hypothetical protein